MSAGKQLSRGCGCIFAIITAIALLVVVMGVDERKAHEDEIRTLLTDATVEGRHEIENYKFTRRYDADGAFEQTSPKPGKKGKWWISGQDHICIQWDDSTRELCRSMMTDDKGSFWKVVPHSSGKVVVTYASFVDDDGNDLRRKIPKPGWWQPWRIIVLTIIAGVWLLLVFLRLSTGRDDPASPRNRLRRRFGKVSAGGTTHSCKELAKLEPSRLDAFALACIREKKYLEAIFALEAMQTQTKNFGTAWGRMWQCMSHLDDTQVLEPLERILGAQSDPKAALPGVAHDPRACYLIGQAFMLRASRHQKTSEAQFTANRMEALHYFGHLRQHGAAPPNLAEPYRAPSPTDYAALVGPAYEAAMYLKYTPPVVARGSSSFAGGG